MITSEPLTIGQVARLCNQAQNASNISGLVLSWAKWMPCINRHAEVLGIAQNLHPINLVMADKLVQLASAELDAMVYIEVDKLAMEP